ncbi:hypothetical protein KI688_000367 [Linnemannia hyalina]|uniref:SET domain-containing protein n=1 Tax=Linnemannia hyalina TaxID=64524 RepID=A0A9P8BYP4_9FUNG|nr:hypothetical protein KI688_000367 [Linnemannia hyalina]
MTQATTHSSPTRRSSRSSPAREAQQSVPSAPVPAPAKNPAVATIPATSSSSTTTAAADTTTPTTTTATTTTTTTTATATTATATTSESSTNADTNTTAATNGTDGSAYTRHTAPKRSNVKPRWHTQPYMMFLALRAMPNRTAARQELISAAVALDRKFSAEKGLPKVFTGKTPMNSASACLTNNGDKYFIPFKPEGSRSTHFRLAYQPGDFDTAVKEYDSWMEKLIKHDWPLCFGVPKEGAVPIDVLELHERARLAALELNAPETVIAADPSASSIELAIEKFEFIGIPSVDSTSVGSRKRSPEPLDQDATDDSRNVKKIKSELDSAVVSDTALESAAQLADQGQDQDSKVVDKLEQLELRATPSLPSTPASVTGQESETTPSTPTSAAAKATSAGGPSSKSESQRVDEYRLEDLDLSSVPTSLMDVVRVAESTIPNSGNGLFARIDLPASTPLGFYFGVPMTENEFDSLKDGVGVASHYSIMYRRTVLDATDEKGMPYSDPNGRLYCPFHFMNEDPNGNISFITGSVVNQVICTTSRDVKAGEELFVFYGKEVDRFWAQGQDGSGSEGGDAKKGRAGSRSRATSPVRREEHGDRPRRNNIYKPARYTR